MFRIFNHLSLLALIALFTTTTVVGCNTFEGAGEDVEATGEAMQGDDADEQ